MFILLLEQKNRLKFLHVLRWISESYNRNNVKCFKMFVSQKQIQNIMVFHYCKSGLSGFTFILWLLWCSVRFTHSLIFFPWSHTHTLSHTFIIGQIFPLQSQTATGSSSLLLIFHVSLFPAESITAGILSHEQTGLSVFASKYFNFTGLFWLGPALNELLVYVSVLCECLHVFGQ